MKNFDQIDRMEYDYYLSILRTGETDFKGRWYTNGLFDAFITENKESVYIKDLVEGKYYRTSTVFIGRIFYSLNSLRLDDLYIREGFVDKSLNTDMFSPINKFKFLVGPNNIIKCTHHTKKPV